MLGLLQFRSRRWRRYQKHHEGTSLGFSSAEAGAASKDQKQIAFKRIGQGYLVGGVGQVFQKGQAAAYPLGLFRQMGQRCKLSSTFHLQKKLKEAEEEAQQVFNGR